MQVYFIVSEQFRFKKVNRGTKSLLYAVLEISSHKSGIQFVRRIPLHNFPDMLITFSFNVVLYLTCNKVYGAFLVVQTACNAEDHGSIPGSGRSPGEGNTHSSFLTREFHGERSLAGYSPWGHKESDTTE